VSSQRAVNRPADGVDNRPAPQETHPAPPVSVQPVPWLTVEEAAQYLSVKPRTLLLRTRQGKVRGYPLSGTRRHVWRYRYADLDAAMLHMPSVALPKRRDE
jgi:excisionase family DNA binding protein